MITDLVVGYDHSIREHHTTSSFGPDADAVIDDNYAGGRHTKLEENLLFG
jgi:hypothetical protein